MTSEHVALISLAVALLGALIVSTWRLSSLATKLTTYNEALQRKDTEFEQGLKALAVIPQLETRLGYLEKNHSMIPRLSADIEVLKAGQKHSGEMRRVLLRQSRPEHEDDE